MKTFDELWNAASSWAEHHSQSILAQGKELTPDQIIMARNVGVKNPEKIRMLVVPSVPFPDDPVIREIGESVGLRQSSTDGMAMQYGLYIKEGHAENKRLLFHELRHVAQYECFGSIRNFMFFYLRELIHFQYGLGPLEVDAKKAEEAAQV